MVKICLKGRMGNQLFQFAYAYLVSKERKTNIFINPTSYFGFRLDLFSLPLMFRFLPLRVFVKAHRILFRLFKSDSIVTENSCFYHFQLPEFKGNVELDGFFQDGRAYSKHRVELLSVFKIRSSIETKFQNKYASLLKQKNAVLNIRIADDYKVAYFDEIKSKGILPVDWYLSALEKVNLAEYDNLIVISDSIEEVKKLEAIAQFNPIFINDGPHTDFLFLMNADLLIIPNSSFSWWGAFLNQRKNRRILAPKNWVGYHVGMEYPTGIMIDEFEWI